ncbi:5649_t:CDS:1, partial [Scutellospora calospora]
RDITKLNEEMVETSRENLAGSIEELNIQIQDKLSESWLRP